MRNYDTYQYILYINSSTLRWHQLLQCLAKELRRHGNQLIVYFIQEAFPC